MIIHNPMNHSTAHGQLSWKEPEGLALLGIPISQEVQQIALAFASEQRNVKKGKQVFLNTLSVIAVHKCLKMFGFESYLESGDCWNKRERSLFDVADLLIQDFGRIECFPILPKQESIEIEDKLDELDLLENRVGCVGVKFHEHFNYVEMLGFKLFDKAVKSQLEKTRTLDVRDFQPFEDIFYRLVPTPIINILDVLRNQISETQLAQAGLLTEEQYKKDPELSKHPIPLLKDHQKVRLYKKIEIEENHLLYKICVAIIVTLKNYTERRVTIELQCLNQSHFPALFSLKVSDTNQKMITVNLPNSNTANQSFDDQKAGNLFTFDLEFSQQNFSNSLLL